ncbi:transcriptional repressor [Patescibacteria group bacterium]|nr:transcriptional repressor [Patescibacteria group bacterium]
MNDHVSVDLLKAAGLRATKQRILLLRALIAEQHPFSVEDIRAHTKNALDTATIYRTLEIFKEKNLVRQVELAQGRALYEYAGNHHHHIVCTSCGTIRDLDICLPKTLHRSVREVSGFSRVNEHALEFFGVCNKCV